MKINNYAVGSGRLRKENDEIINVADILHNVYDSINNVLKTSKTSPITAWKAIDNKSSAQNNIELIPPPGENLSIYITDIIFSNGQTEGTIKLVENTISPIDIIKPIYLSSNSGAHLPLKTPIKLTKNKNLGYTSVGVTTHSIIILGYID